MQRDAYAALIKKQHHARIPIRILQLNGRITQEYIFSDVFIGYKRRRIVLMTHFAYGSHPQSPLQGYLNAPTAGVIPSCPPPQITPKDFVISSFEKLAKIHDPRLVYKLVPLLCADIDTFAALQAICSSYGSPFSIEDRRDPMEMTHRFVAGCFQREAISEFFRKHIPSSEMEMPAATRKLPISGIEFQGLMLATSKRMQVDHSGRLEDHEQLKKSADGLGKSAEEVQPMGTAGCASSDHLTLPSSISKLSLGEIANESAKPHRQNTYEVTVGAFLTTHESLNEKVLLQRTLCRDFFQSPLHWKIKTRSSFVEEVRRTEQQMHFMAVKRSVGSEPGSSRKALLENAKTNNIFIYERVDDELYQFAV